VLLMTQVLTIFLWIALILLFWTYFGYPLLMYLRAKAGKQLVQESEEYTPGVCILIPTFNEADVIRRKLENAIALNYPQDLLEIIVIDDDSQDATPEIVAEFAPRVKLIRKEKRSGKMQSVNIGMQATSAEIVILSDASPDYEQDSLRYLVQPFSQAKIGVVVGKLAIWDAENGVVKSAGLYWKYEAALRKWESQTGNTFAVHGNMFALRRELYRPMSNGTINDEFSIAMNIIKEGYRVVYQPKAISYDHASSQMEDEFARRVRINAGRFQALFGASYLTTMPTFEDGFRLVSHKFLRPLAPIFMIITLLASVLLVLMRTAWIYDLFLLGQLLFYGLAALGWLLEKRQIKLRALSIFYFFVSTNLAALFGFWRWLKGTQSVTWQKRQTVESSLD
jgi:poly-beta-1,6-N-acetyl-D-glucosamine synthase